MGLPLRPLGMQPSRLAAGISAWFPINQSYWLCILLAASVLGPLINAQELDERAIRVAYVFNLTKCCGMATRRKSVSCGLCRRWPYGRSTGEDASRKDQRLPTQFMALCFLPAEEDLDQCDIVYFAASSTKKVHKTLDHLRDEMC